MAVTLNQTAGIVAVTLLLASCANQEVILPGERLDLPNPAAGSAGAKAVARAVPFVAPQMVPNTSWTHANGSAGHVTPHPALAGAPKQVWSVKIGSGDSRKHRITATPVVDGGRIFAMDSQSVVTAVSTSGQRLWSASIAPGFDDEDDASGGGLAVGGDTLYATTGFGTLTALNVGTGQTRWTQRVDAAISGAPTVYGELVYMVSRDGIAWAVHVDDGRIAWSLPGVPAQAGMTGGAAPAISDEIAVFPFGSGDLVASFPLGGVLLWTASLAGQRTGRAYAVVGDITGDPVIDGDVVYGGTSAGRTAAIDLRSGERRWTVRDGAMSPVWPAGGSVFSVTDESQLLRLDAESGESIWAVDLPYYRNPRPKRREAIHPQFGPVLAGGRLRVASGDGVLRSFDPATGALVATADIPGGAATNMAVAGGVLYVVSTRGQLLAFR